MLYDYQNCGPEEILRETLREYPCLIPCEEAVRQGYRLLENCFAGGGKLMTAGNGGSAADSGHIVGELMKGFMSTRPLNDERRRALPPGDAFSRLQGALPAVDLTAQNALITAYANDVDPELVFAQQVYGYARAGDAFWGLSTSGNSRNIVAAARVAASLGVKTLAVTGESGGALKELCDVCIQIPSCSTPVVQERTIPVYHTICMMLEKRFFGAAEGRA